MRFRRYLTLRAARATNKLLRLDSWAGVVIGGVTLVAAFFVIWGVNGFEQSVTDALSSGAKALVVSLTWPLVFAYYVATLPAVIFGEQRRQIVRLSAQARPGPKPVISPRLQTLWEIGEQLSKERYRELDRLPPWQAEFDKWKAEVTATLDGAGYPHEAIGFKTTYAEAKLIENASKAQSALLCELFAKLGKFRLIWMRIAEKEAA